MKLLMENSIEQDAFKKYIKLIRKKKLLSNEEQQEIVEQLKKETDDLKKKKLYEKLIETNLRFVITIARKYQNKYIDLMDLISEGNIGLIKAAERYDPYSNIKFISYAVWWIRQSILSFLNEYSRTIRLPTNIVQESFKYKKEENLNDDIYYNEAHNIPYCVDLYDQTYNQNKKNLESESDALDLICDDDNEFDDDFKTSIRELLNFLDEREKIVIEKYYGFNDIEYNLDDLGEEFGCTKERIRQLKDKAIKKLRNESYNLIKLL